MCASGDDAADPIRTIYRCEILKMRTVALLLVLLASPAAFADDAPPALMSLQPEEIRLIGIAGVVSAISYEIRFNDIDFSFNPMNQNMMLKIKF
jgi:hypothetical protein